MTAAILDRLLDPLDALRRFVFVEAQRVPVLGRVLARRDLRLLAQSLLGVSFALLLTLGAPGIPYVLGPALLGVPHVVSELRFLVVRRTLPRGLVVAAVGLSSLLVALRVAEAIAPRAIAWAPVEVGLGWGLATIGAVAGAVAASSKRRGAIVLAPIAAVSIWAVSHPGTAQLLFAHAHNVITIALWVWLFRRRPLFAIPSLVAIAACALWLASGDALSHVRFAGPFVERLVDESMRAVPRFVPQRNALGLGLAFVFLQSIHYAVWLAWIPQEDLRAEGTTSFKMSARGLVRDLGALGAAVAIFLSVLVVGASFVDVHRTRGLYLSLATFHGYLEVAMLAFFVAKGALPRGETR